MNWQHFRTFLWLRRRILINQIARTGILNLVVWIILVVIGIGAAIGSFFGALALAVYGLAESSPFQLLLVWDGVIVVFLIVWLIALVTDLQRSEALSLNKFLHLPVTPTGVFLINYLSSLFNLRLILFVPAMLGLIFGLAYVRSATFLLSLPLLAAFLLMVTSLTNQFQSWLASLMSDKRRRRTVIVFLTFGVILIAQIPNLAINVFGFGMPKQNDAANKAKQEKFDSLTREHAELTIALTAKRRTFVEYQKRSEEILKELQSMQATTAAGVGKDTPGITKQAFEKAEGTVRILNLVLPPGWLASGIAALSQAVFWPALSGTAGFGLIGGASLWRSYQTTLRIYTGESSTGAGKIAADGPVSNGTLLVEWKIPLVSEPVAAIALGSVRSLLRAPEAKMMFLTTPLMLLIFGSMLVTRSKTIPDPFRPLAPCGAMAMVLFSMIGIVGNQFAFDRGGFRVFVFSGTKRGDILLGKNLAFAPFALGLGGVAAIVLECIYPMWIDHFLAVLLQFMAMYLIFCLVGNLLSILVPLYIAPGTLRPTNLRILPVLVHLLTAFLFPLALAVTLIPFGVEALLEWLGYRKGVPVALVLMAVGFAIIALLYRILISWQGALLQHREQTILELVAPKVE